MARESEKQLEIAEFSGLMTNMGDYVGPPGGTDVQENVTIVTEGELRIRSGTREVSFEA